MSKSAKCQAKNIVMPNDGAAEQGLRLLINNELPTRL